MSAQVPTNKIKWESLAQEQRIDILSNCRPLPSGSKFRMEHYLPLRILFFDEKNFNRRRRNEFRGQHFPANVAKNVLATMKKNKSIQEIQGFLKKIDSIKDWNVEKYRDVGPFGNGLEKLYQIVSKSLAIGDSDEDATDLKIFAPSLGAEPLPNLPFNLAAKLQMVTIDATDDRSPTSKPHTPLLKRPNLNRAARPGFMGAEDDSITFDTPGTDLSSMPGTEKRLAQRDFERATFLLSDEQTINMCLENLLIALSNAMGFYGRIFSDRKAFVIPKLYQACVDGLIMTADRQQIMAFIEVKRSLRSTNDSVLRQIGAQMAAFIFSYDHIINKGYDDLFKISHSVSLSLRVGSLSYSFILDRKLTGVSE